MNSLLPPGSTPLERRLAQTCSGISDLQVPLRDLWKTNSFLNGIYIYSFCYFPIAYHTHPANNAGCMDGLSL